MEISPIRCPGLARRRLAAIVSGAALSLGLMRAAVAATCLPPGVGVLNSEAGDAVRETVARAPAATVFLDVSGSMAGYVGRAHVPPSARPVAGARAVTRPRPPEEPRTFHDVVQSLPQLASSVADTVALFAFGKTIRPLAQAELGRAGRPEFYADQDSRIQDALVRMDSLPPEELGLLVTDLFLTGEEIFGGAAAIRAPLASILESGRTIALIGIRSGFSGKIFDIPGVKAYADASERPFYVIATGPGLIVARLLRRLETELIAPLPPPTDGTSRCYATLFTHKPFQAGTVLLPMIPAGHAEPGTRLSADLGPDVSGILFPKASGTASATVPISSMVQGPVLVPDRFKVQEHIWAEPMQSGARASCRERWVEVHSLPKMAHMEGSAEAGLVVSVGGAALTRVPPGTTFFLRAQVSAVALSESPAQMAWTKEWNLEARDAEAYVSSHPVMFRTLNLREISSMLEGLVRDRITPVIVAEAQLAFQVPKG